MGGIQECSIMEVINCTPKKAAEIMNTKVFVRLLCEMIKQHPVEMGKSNKEKLQGLWQDRMMGHFHYQIFTKKSGNKEWRSTNESNIFEQNHKEVLDLLMENRNQAG